MIFFVGRFVARSIAQGSLLENYRGGAMENVLHRRRTRLLPRVRRGNRLQGRQVRPGPALQVHRRRRKDEVVGSITVEKGNSEFINAVPQNEINILVKKDEKQSIKKEVKIPARIQAPIKKGDVVGEIIVYKNDQILEKHPLISESDVKRAGLIKIYIKMLKEVI